MVMVVLAAFVKVALAPQLAPLATHTRCGPFGCATAQSMAGWTSANGTCAPSPVTLLPSGEAATRRQLQSSSIAPSQSSSMPLQLESFAAAGAAGTHFETAPPTQAAIVTLHAPRPQVK